MKMVIADDESLIRASLISMINDIETSWDIAGEASNGQELVELIRMHKPNVAIIDIRMPKLNGLEAMRLGKELSPQTKWIILSGYSDFSYAQEAIKLGASEYLLKPVNPVDLEKALYNTYKDNKEFIRLLNQQFENSLFALCNGLTTLRQEPLDSIYYLGGFVGATFSIDSARNDNELLDIQSEFYHELRQNINNHLIHGMNIVIISLPSSETAVIASWDPSKGMENKERILHFFDSLEEIVQRFRNDDIVITTLQTDECNGFEALNNQLQMLQQWSCLRTVCGMGQRLRYSQLLKESGISDKAKSSSLLCIIKQHLQNRAYLSYQVTVNELEALVLKSELPTTEQSHNSIGLFMRYALGITASTETTSGKQMIKELRSFGEIFLQDLKPKELVSADLIDQVIQYIEKCYMDDIGIGQIASQLNVTPNYLSTLFHKKTGILFVKYLTNIRMLKAKELLMNTNLQVKQIAEKVGYYSTRHFTKLFTETYTSYPSDYRKGHL
jgi:two-component system response regulator YesN